MHIVGSLHSCITMRGLMNVKFMKMSSIFEWQIGGTDVITSFQVCCLLQNRKNTNGTYNSAWDFLIHLSFEFVNLELACLICGNLVLLSKYFGVFLNNVKVKKTEHRVIFRGFCFSLLNYRGNHRMWKKYLCETSRLHLLQT